MGSGLGSEAGSTSRTGESFLVFLAAGSEAFFVVAVLEGGLRLARAGSDAGGSFSDFLASDRARLAGGGDVGRSGEALRLLEVPLIPLTCDLGFALLAGLGGGLATGWADAARVERRGGMFVNRSRLTVAGRMRHFSNTICACDGRVICTCK